MSNDQHIYHHDSPTIPHISVKAEKNSKGVNWEVSVSGAESVAQAMELLDSARKELESRFGGVATQG